MDRDNWNDRYRTSRLVWTDQANQFLVAETSDLPPGRALDLAAGEGRNAVWLARQGWQVSAVDFSAVALAKARRLADRHHVSLRLVEADLTSYVPERQAADLVVMAYLHLPEPDRTTVLRRAQDAVAPAGVLLVIGHDRSNLDHGYGGPQDPAVLARPEEIAAILDDLVIERAEPVPRQVDTPDGPRTAIDQLIRATRAQRPSSAQHVP